MGNLGHFLDLGTLGFANGTQGTYSGTKNIEIPWYPLRMYKAIKSPIHLVLWGVGAIIGLFATA